MRGYAHKVSQHEDEVKYESEIEIPAGFGEVGAVLVENEHHKEMHLKSVVLHGFPNGSINFACNSWVHSKFDNPNKRIFFANKVSNIRLYIHTSISFFTFSFLLGIMYTNIN